MTVVAGMVDGCVVKNELPVPQWDRFASQRSIQFAGGRQNRIVDLFRFESLKREFLQQPILGIHLLRGQLT